MPKKKPFPLEVRAAIANDYRAGLSADALSLKNGCSTCYINHILRDMGVQKRSLEMSHKRYSLTESVFDNPAPEGEYWVGFLMADGCVLDRGNSFAISVVLSVKDLNHLEKFKRFLGSGHPIEHGIRPRPTRFNNRPINPGEAVRLVFSSSRIGNALKGFGVVPRKSYTAKAIGLENSKDFWRGVIDGDGSVFLKGAGRKHPVLSLVGSEQLINQFAEFVRRNGGQTKAKPLRRRNIWSFRVHANIAQTVIRLLYGNCSVALDRKAEMAQRAMAWVPFQKDRTSLTLAKMNALVDGCGGIRNAAEAAGMSYDNFCTRRCALRKISQCQATDHNRP